MKDNFSSSLKEVLKHEGGYSNHPQDPGGATMRGVTQRVYDAYRKNSGLEPRNVRSISDAELKDIYKRQYWDAVSGDDLPSGVDYAVFDFAVNSGPGRAVKALQSLLGESQDGIVGHRTIMASKNSVNKVDLINSYCDERLFFVRRLKNYSVFGKGWENRIAGVRSNAVRMSSQSAAPESFTQDQVGYIKAKADPSNVDISKTDSGRAGAIAGLGVIGSAVTDATAQMSIVKDYSPALQWVFIGLTMLGVVLGLYITYKRIKGGHE